MTDKHQIEIRPRAETRVLTGAHEECKISKILRNDKPTNVAAEPLKSHMWGYHILSQNKPSKNVKVFWLIAGFGGRS